jgi:hypothetical protein
MKTDVGQWRTTFLKPSPCMDRRSHRRRGSLAPAPDSLGVFRYGGFRRIASEGTIVNTAGRPVQDLNPYVYVLPKPRLAVRKPCARLVGFPFSLVYEARDLPPASAGGRKGNRSPKRASAWLLEETSAPARKPCARLARAPSSPPHYPARSGAQADAEKRAQARLSLPFSSHALRLKPGHAQKAP